MTLYFFQPFDVWLFRDGRPFDVGIGHRAQSIFPPFPTAVQGAIRTNQLALQKVNLHDKAAIKEAVGDTENYLSLRLKGPILARKEGDKISPYFPLPHDAITLDQEKGLVQPASKPEPVGDSVLVSSENLYVMGLRDQPMKSSGSLWLSHENLIQYLAGQQVCGIKESNLFVREARVSNSLDQKTRTVVPGGLFEIEFIRPQKGVGLLVEINGYEWSDQGLLRFGGDSKGASYQKIPDDFSCFQNVSLDLPQKFKMCFTTPTWFDDGWQPKDWSQFFDGKVTLRCAAVGRYQSVGGFDYAKKWHKPSRRFVPAGSVYYFECDGSCKIRSGLIQNAFTQWGAEIGFGQFILGKEW